MSDEPKNRVLVLPELSGEVAPDSVLARLEAKLDWLAAALNMSEPITAKEWLEHQASKERQIDRLEEKLDWLAQAVQKLPDVRAAMEPMWIENASSPYPPSLPPYPEKP